jgi:hypothetical protein
MQNESRDSVVSLVRNIAQINENLDKKATVITITKTEYQLLIKELWELDIFLKEKYPDYQSVPKIYTLFGVKIEVL